MTLLDDLESPSDLRSLDAEQLSRLAGEIRTFLIESVCRSGGHLGPNLGVVELTIAVHRVFDSPFTPIVFDTGHQAYVHKLLTGRQAGFAGLRSAEGLSGYPKRSESAHDWTENSHASTALSYADGLSKAFALAGSHRTVVAVVGDGALTGGLSWEALNNLGVSERPVVIVLNDNGRSYAPTFGALPRHLGRIRDRQRYTDVLDMLSVDRIADRAEPPAPMAGLFTDLGFQYLGPVNGHDTAAVEEALSEAGRRGRPVVVHCVTEKGRGYRPAETDPVDRLHTVGVVDPATGLPAPPPQGKAPSVSWTRAFGDALVELGEEVPEVVAVSAAMIEPIGMRTFAERFPDRCFDVGIAEQHAITSAAGLALGGAHPVVGLYATFACRAFDQLLLDVGLLNLPVTLSLDRAGITGPDGPSHHGIWDLSMLGGIPGMSVAAPRDARTLREELREAVGYRRGPTALRYPRGALGPDVPERERRGGIDLLRGPDHGVTLVVAVGATAAAAVEAADVLADEGVECTVVDPRWVLPIRPSLIELASGFRHVVTVEDGVASGGVGAHLARELSTADAGVRVSSLALPVEYIPHASRGELLARYGLDATGIAAAVRTAHARSAPWTASSARAAVAR